MIDLELRELLDRAVHQLHLAELRARPTNQIVAARLARLRSEIGEIKLHLRLLRPEK